jgi:hypothetical protein
LCRKFRSDLVDARLKSGGGLAVVAVKNSINARVGSTTVVLLEKFLSPELL